MAFSFLVSFEVLNAALNPNIKGDFAVTSKQAVTIIGDFYEEESCEIYANSHTFQKVKQILNGEQFVRFEGIFEPERKTHGVDGYDHKNSDGECAKNLSYKGNTIILLDKNEKESFVGNTRTHAVTPSEIITALDDAQTVAKVMDEKSLLKCLILAIARPDLVPQVPSEEEEEENSPEGP